MLYAFRDRNPAIKPDCGLGMPKMGVLVKKIENAS